MNILVAYCLLALAVVYAFVTSKYVLGAALAFIVIIVWGLLMIYKTTGDREILGAADRAMTQQIEMLRKMGVKLCDTGTAAMVGMPSCSILKPLVMLYRETGKQLYLDYAREIVSYWDRPDNPAPNFFPNAATGRPLNEWYPDRTGRWGKAYEMMSCLDGVLEFYRTRVCDFPSAGDSLLPDGANAFSIFF